ncbi:MAG TPA: cell envelope integrity protein CreD [Magnetospirillum sp.]|nr:cell envelope integrity protein CreD [Magnetospirillum sp.]
MDAPKTTSAPAGAGYSRLSAPVRRLAPIAVLLIATLIGGLITSSLIDEREERQNDVREEFARTWGPGQLVRAPVLVIPFQSAADQPRQYLKLAPSALKNQVGLAPETRRRGMFEATVYTASVTMEGAFTLPSQAKLDEVRSAAGKLFLGESFIMVETLGLSGMTERDGLVWNGETLPWQNCRQLISRDDDCQGTAAVGEYPRESSLQVNGAVVAQPAPGAMPQPNGKIAFKATMTLRGTGAFELFVPGRQVDVRMDAPWPTPSFLGSLLPASYNVGEKAFDAEWHAAEPTAAQQWSSSRAVDAKAWRGASIGVQLIEATPTYRMINRASKYNVLFVTLAFTTYFLFELLSGLRIHVVQYGLLGVSLTLFGVLLLSLSETLGYTAGYGISSALILAQASLYTASVAKRVVPVVIFSAMLASLFGFLYVVLSLENYSLLVGSLALFVVLSVIMALTQRVDWSSAEPADKGR